jgi:hypothetical protein
MSDRYNDLYAQFKLNAQTLNLVKNILKVDPYTESGCAAILVYAFLVDSYHIPELVSSHIVTAIKDVITSRAFATEGDPVAIVMLDKAFAVLPTEPVSALNMIDLSLLTEEELVQVVSKPITSDVIDISAVVQRVILPVLQAREAAAEPIAPLAV